MRLLITGGCGFLGTNLAVDALNHGDEIVLFDNLSRCGAIENLLWLRQQGIFTFVNGDIRSRTDIERVVREFKPDAVYHLAGQVAMTSSITAPQLDFEVNVVGTYNILESTRLYSGNSIIVYSSTNKVYGDLNQFTYSESNTRHKCIERPDGFDEITSLDFHSPYGCSKGAADQYMMDYARTYGLKTVVLRHSSMYGGRQFATTDQGWIGWFCTKAIEISTFQAIDPLTISGSGKQVRDILHVDDIKVLYRSVVDNIDTVRGQAFNIGGGVSNSLSLIELFSYLESNLAIELNYTKLPARQSDQLFFVADISKAKRMLGWTPLISAEDGLDQMIRWIKSR